jgi:hypothetical protein
MATVELFFPTSSDEKILKCKILEELYSKYPYTHHLNYAVDTFLSFYLHIIIKSALNSI